jgi:hypothetical protein
MRSAIIGAVLVLGACTSHGEERDGPRATGQRSFQVGQFQAVSLEGSHDVVVTVGGAPSVRAEGDSEELERLDIRVEGDTLKIGSEQRRRWFSFRQGGRVTVYVTVPALNGATIAGSGDMRVDRVQAPSFEAEIAGSGDMEIGQLRARRASFSIAGSGGISAMGEAEQAAVSIAGSGSVTLDRLQTRRTSVSVMGSGDVSVRASEAVEGSVMGSGDVTVHGTARCSISKMGSGDVHCGA